MKLDLVFEGGGVLGISFVGAYQALMEHNFEIERCAGTSAGSIIATLIIAGYKPDELSEILNRTNFKRFMKKTKLSHFFVIGKILSLIFNDGIYNSQSIECWMDDLLDKKNIHTFKDIMVNDESPLKIIVADITRRKMMIIPDDLPNYGINPDDFSIAKAVRMSCTIPFFYTPVKLKDKNKIIYTVDGGLLSTFPIWIFDINHKPKWPTFGLKIKDACSHTSLGKHHFFAFLQDIINAPINRDEMTYVRDKDLVRTIIIDNDHHLKSTDFRLTEKEEEYLYQQGYQSVNKFLKKWNYTEYIKRFMV